MTTATCHCSAIRVAVPAPPAYLNQCHCSICRRYGVLWAYYPADEVKLQHDLDATETYIWNQRMIEFHRCRTCGCVAYWTPVNKTTNRVGINGRLFDEAEVLDVRVEQRPGPGNEWVVEGKVSRIKGADKAE